MLMRTLSPVIRVLATVTVVILLCTYGVQGADTVQQPRTDPAEKKIPQKGLTPSKIRQLLSGRETENFIVLNFDNADLRDVISTISQISGANFIISPGVEARITIHSSKKIPVGEVMNVFESVLEVNNLSLVKVGSFYKIIQSPSIKQKPLEVKKGNIPEEVPDRDVPVTQIIPVRFVPATEVSALLTPLLSPVGNIAANARNNLLVVSDYQANIRRLLSILSEIDVNAFENTRMFFFKPKYSDVISLSNELNDVLSALNLGEEGLAVVPIERINSLVIFSSSHALLEAVKGWIKRLDEEVVSGQNIFIYPVQNVKASDIAEILKSLYETEGTTTRRRITQRRTTKRGKTPQRVARPRVIPRRSGQASRVEIMVFEPTNSLVIYAPPGVYRDMVNTIKKMDVYPREVLIEAIIAEVTHTGQDELGLQWSVLHHISAHGTDWTGVAGGSYGNAPSLITDTPTLASGPAGLSYVLFRPDKVTALFRALASESKINILSSPSLLVKDQEEATIEVGSEIPTATSTTTSTDLNTLTQSIEYRTVGIKLKIKPTISEERTVVLDVEQEVSDKGGDQQVGPQGNEYPVFTTTKTKTSIVVPDRMSILIGGIMKEKKSKSYQGIPLLSKIPLIGALFRYQVNDTTKDELIIVLTPKVVTNKTEADFITSEYMQKLKELKEYLKKKADDSNNKDMHRLTDPPGS